MKSIGCIALLSIAAWMSSVARADAALHYKFFCEEGSLPDGKRCHGLILVDENDVPIRAAAPW